MTETIHPELCGQLHNLDDLARRLGLPPEERRDAIAVLRAAWRRWGEALAEQLVGDFALALRDDARRLTYLVRHPLGVKPLFYRVDDDVLSYGFTVPQLRARCPLPATKDMDWAAAYVMHLSFSRTQTAYREIRKLEPGHWLSCDDLGRITIRRYHQWRDDAPDATRRDPRWLDEFQVVFEEAVRCRMDTDAPIGTEHSGGLDSGAITACLARLIGAPEDRLVGFAIAARPDEETARMLALSRAVRLRQNYVLTEQLGVRHDDERLRRSLAALGYPEGHRMASTYGPFHAECQRRGIRTLFSGFGGDEIVSYQANQGRSELVDRHRYRALWDILPGNPVGRSLRFAKALTVGRCQGTHNAEFLAQLRATWLQQLLRPELIQELDMERRFYDQAVVDAPYRRVNDAILRHHLMDMGFTQRLEDCTVCAAAYGVDYRWPLWDVRLVQQYLSTPTIEKVGPGGAGRYLLERVLTRLVPERAGWVELEGWSGKTRPRSRSQARARARAHARAQTRGVDEVRSQDVPLAEELLVNLHPSLEELIDPGKLRAQMEQMRSTEVTLEFALTLRRSLDALRTLNCWLYG